MLIINYTKNLRLRKPEGGEYYSVDDFNNNADVLDAAVAEKADKPSSFAQGNLASVGADGNLLDSGKKADDFAATDHNHEAVYAPIAHVSDGDIHVSAAEKAAISAVANKADRSYVDLRLLGAVQQLAAPIDYYVSSSGHDDSGDGSENNPWASINFALSKLPKNLGGHNATIHIAEGNYTENIKISSFYNGILNIMAAQSCNSEIHGYVAAKCCQAQIGLYFLKVSCTSPATSYHTDGVISASYCYLLSIFECEIDGNNKQRNGVLCWGQSNIGITTTKISNTKGAITTSSNSGTLGVATVQAYSVSGSNNDLGIVANSAIVSVYNFMLSAATNYSTRVGGIIVTDKGAIL